MKQPEYVFIVVVDSVTPIYLRDVWSVHRSVVAAEQEAAKQRFAYPDRIFSVYTEELL